MLHQIRYSLILFFLSTSLLAQDTLMPLNFNTQLLEIEDGMAHGLKAGIPEKIYVDLDSSKYILVDDFSYNSHRPYDHYWKDRAVYINRNFAVNPVTVGVATFDGLDDLGYPYNFITPTSYGACDTLTSLPIELSTVDQNTDDPIYLSFSYQPQGISPFSPSDEDSIILEFFQPFRYDTTIENINGTLVTSIDSFEINRWFRVWGQSGYDLNASDTGCNFAFRSRTIQVPPYLYQDSFQFRFVNYGNTSGNVDQWHLDFVVLSSDANGHNDLGDYAFIKGIGSLIKEYEAMPWFHYRGNENRYARDRKMRYHMRNTFSSEVTVDLEYAAYDPLGNVVDGISSTVAFTPISAKSCKREAVPLAGDPNHTFLFQNASIPDNTTTYFLTQNILKRRIGSIDLIELNNQVEQYQIFGSYYAYDDGSAEAGYGVKADDGMLAVQFVMPPGITDTLTAFYIHFNPVVVDRSNQRFRLTVWGDDGSGFPGDIIYENTSVGTPRYLKEGVNFYDKWRLNEPVLVSDTFYIGYQKLTEDVLNIGYDLNKESNNKIFVSLGGPFQKGVSVSQKGSIMIRPSFRNISEPAVGLKEPKEKVEPSLHLFPNPAENVLNYNIDDKGFSTWQARLMSLDGRLMNSFRMETQGQIDVSDMPNGLYLLLLNNEQSGVAIAKKFLIKH